MQKLIVQKKFSFYIWNWNDTYMKYYSHMWISIWNFVVGEGKITNDDDKIDKNNKSWPFQFHLVLIYYAESFEMVRID